MKVLVIEDDADTAEFIARGFKEADCAAVRASTGVDGLFLANEGGCSVLVVDRMLPGRDGLQVVRTLRAAGIQTPHCF